MQAYNHIANVSEKERTADIWKLGGKIMIKAERYVLAELHLKKASKLQNFEDEETLQLFQLARTKRLYDPICEVTSRDHFKIRLKMFVTSKKISAKIKVCREVKKVTKYRIFCTSINLQKA